MFPGASTHPIGILAVPNHMQDGDAYPDFDVAAIITNYDDRLRDFIVKKKFFATDETAAAFCQTLRRLADDDIAGNRLKAQLRQEIRSHLQGGVHGSNDRTITARLAADMHRFLRSSDAIFPSGSNTPENMLDVGCGSGIITSTLAECFSIPRSRAVGLDIFIPENIPQNITMLRMQKNDIHSAVGDAQFELLILSMVLHHSGNPAGLLRQAWDSVRPGGYLLLKEHDAPAAMHAFLDAVHVFHEQIFPERQLNLPNEKEYRPLDDWRQLAEEIGFTYHAVAYESYDDMPSNTGNNFTMLLKKVER